MSDETIQLLTQAFFACVLAALAMHFLFRACRLEQEKNQLQLDLWSKERECSKLQAALEEAREESLASWYGKED